MKELKPEERKRILRNSDPPDVELPPGARFFFNYQLGRSGMQIKGNNSKYYYMTARMGYWNRKKSAPFDDDKFFHFEKFFKYDWLTEFMNLQDFLKNPLVVENRFIELSYEDIRQKGFSIVSKRVADSSQRVYKGQRVWYFLHHRSQPFPPGCSIQMSVPSGVVIKLDQKRNLVKLEGPNCKRSYIRFLSVL